MDDATAEDELAALVCLNQVPGVGPLTFRALRERFGSAARVLGAPASLLREVPGIGPKLADRIAHARKDYPAQEEIDRCPPLGVALLPSFDHNYPARLAEIPDPPALLYLRGGFTHEDRLAVAIVGSRNCTPYGQRITQKLASSLARTGLTIVSGLARGIDSVAHHAALDAGGRTIAVLANGLAEVYPPEHRGLADEIARSGAIVSESPLGQKPIAGLFPQRNRIISGLTLGVVVIEATPRSGTLSTARHALEQGREVFAVPGPVDSLSSRGCHQLIKDGAKLVETADDILEELKPFLDGRPPAAPVRQRNLFDAAPVEAAPSAPAAEGLPLSDIERALLAAIAPDQPTPIDAVIARSGLTSAQAMAHLSLLEMRRLIRRAPGQVFTRIL